MGKRENWNRLAHVWEQRIALQAAQPDPYSTVALDVLPLSDEMRILDIGCGPGVASIELAERAGPSAHVTGVDISPVMINLASHRVRRSIMRGHITPHNIELRVADAERDDLGSDHDVVFSRFGVMFFDDPTKAFTRIAESLKPQGWLSFVAWAAAERNPWMWLPSQAAAEVLGVEAEPEPSEPTGPGPFSLADRAATVGLLTDAGFVDVRVMEITQGRRYRHFNHREAVGLGLRTGPVADAYEQADDTTRDKAIDAVLAAIERYRESGPTGDWVLPAHARAYVARRP